MRVRHRVVDVDFVAVAADARAQRRVHAACARGVRWLHGVQVAGGDQDEVARNGRRADHRTGAGLRLADDGELAFLHRRQQRLLAVEAQHVDLVDEEDALVGAVDGADFDPFVRRRLKAARLERVVADVAEQGAGVAARGFDVGCVGLLLRVVRQKQLGDGEHDGVLALLEQHEHEQDDEETARQSQEIVGAEIVRDVAAHEEEHGQAEEGRDEAPLQDLVDDLLAAGAGSHLGLDIGALAGFDREDQRLVGVLRVVVDQRVVELLGRQHLGHRFGDHRLARTRVADQKQVALLRSRLLGDGDGKVLADDLVDELLRDLDVLGGTDVGLLGDPFVRVADHGAELLGLRGLRVGGSHGLRFGWHALHRFLCFFLSLALMAVRCLWRCATKAAAIIVETLSPTAVTRVLAGARAGAGMGGTGAGGIAKAGPRRVVCSTTSANMTWP